ncbi:NAD-dependent epimerase/dehydratase family protein [Fluviicola chungangensis]|uniref:NAD(P)-dependent oxidoreductase n=1 Tax=Fluviicola chungangensis TaxID=2597671 RepID=A0A556N0I5_9FLAO|nr:NAD(P)-dependent oxidoreductase [Fluviicola chungangensis]TSJ45676.1 NAD(P)-dependent oxidoreductase [Fluviicola chungangensis]
MKKNVIITGATGFVGKHLLTFLDPTKYQYTLLTRNPDKLSANPEGFSVVCGDLNDPESLKKAFRDQDILINLAAEVRNQELLEQTNINGTQHLIEAIRSSGIKRVIHLSSVGVVGKGYSSEPLRVNENELPTPQNRYEQTKLRSEELLLEVHKMQVELVVLRPTNVFGEMHPFNALNNLLNHIQSGKTMVYTKQAQVNYLYVGDLCQSIRWFLENEGHPGVFQVGNSIRLIEFYEKIEQKLKVKGKKWAIPYFLIRCVELIGIHKLRAISNRVIYDDSKLKKLMGDYQFGIDEGLDLTIDYFRKKGMLK